MLERFLGDQLVCVVLYGSIVFDDLAPEYGDLDFLAVVKNDLTKEQREDLVKLRKPLRSGEHGAIATMIEGAFLPRKMLDPSVPGRAFWWGTSGERPWDASKLGWLVLETIRRHGLVIWGEDLRDEIPPASGENLISDIRSFVKGLRDHGRGGGLHSVDWLLTAARELLFLREGRFSSKTEAAGWGFEHAKGEWRKCLPRAKKVRLNPSLAGTEEARRWLEGLTGPIQEAGTELEREVVERLP